MLKLSNRIIFVSDKGLIKVSYRHRTRLNVPFSLLTPSESIIAENNNNKINYWGEKKHLKARSRGKDNESELGRGTKRFVEYVHGQDLLSLEEG